MVQTTTVDLDSDLAVKAADVSLTLKLTRADAIIYAIAQHHGAQVVTSDTDFQFLPDVIYLPKPSQP
jgi:predicted nucleic acid-binding protein